MKQGNLFNKIDTYSCISEITPDEIGHMEDEFGETCAIFVLDSTGFTRISREKGTLFYLYFISKLRRICRKLFPQHNAIDFRFHADNAFAEFKTVDEAVLCARSVVDHFAEKKLNMGKEIFQSCIGIGYGEVVRCNYEGVFGNEMNFTAKLGEDVAEAGQILLTENAYNNISTPITDTSIESVRVSGVDLTYYKVLSF